MLGRTKGAKKRPKRPSSNFVPSMHARATARLDGRDAMDFVVEEHLIQLDIRTKVGSVRRSGLLTVTQDIAINGHETCYTDVAQLNSVRTSHTASREEIHALQSIVNCIHAVHEI